MTGKKFRGYLDRLRENVEVLDEAIENARKMSKPKGKADKAAALQWAKTLRDLVELRNTTLATVKMHLLGRDETGAPNEPDEFWGTHNAEVEFERYFKDYVKPWTEDNLKLRCEDCGVESEDVTHRDFDEIRDSHYHTLVKEEDADLCSQCVEKREAARHQKAEASLAPKGVPVVAGSDPADILERSVRSMIGAVALVNRPSPEKIKMLEEFKERVWKTADEQGSKRFLAPSFVLLDNEIERLKAESGG